MAEPNVADAYSNQQEQDFQASTLKRSSEQEQARIQRMRMMRTEGSIDPRFLRAANDNPDYQAANDNESAPSSSQASSVEDEATAKAQERVNRFRFISAQGVLAPQEEAYNQIQKQEELQPSLLRYSPAFTVAIFKDLFLDPIGVGSLPVLGWLVTFICSSLIFIFLVFAKKNSSIQDMRFIIRRLLIVIVSFAIEGFIFGVNFFPFEIATVAIIYLMDKHLTSAQITGLLEVVHKLDKKRL